MGRQRLEEVGSRRGSGESEGLEEAWAWGWWRPRGGGAEEAWGGGAMAERQDCSDLEEAAWGLKLDWISWRRKDSRGRKDAGDRRKEIVAPHVR